MTGVQTCALPIYSALIENSSWSSGHPCGAVISVKERFNTLGFYEYYCLTQGYNGPTVLKLDNNLQPFPISSPNALNNEFTYNYSYNIPSAIVEACVLTINNTALAVGDPVGFQVAGTDIPAGVIFYFSSYFNGATNCSSTLTTMAGTQPLGIVDQLVPANPMGGFNSCSNFQIVVSGGNTSMNYPCTTSNGTVASGSNQRSLNPATGLTETDFNDGSMIAFPNPVNTSHMLLFAGSKNSKIHIELFNALGQKVAELNDAEETTTGEMKAEINFNALTIEKGIYLISAQIDGKTYREKVIYSK